MGGEKFAPLLYHTSEGGSPPRGRGKAVLEVAAVQAVGITPAWAGKSIPAIGVPGASMGSPLRWRGKVVGHSGVLLDVGITPAWAGKRAHRV